MEKTRDYFIPFLAESFNDFIKRNHKGYNSKKQVKDAIKNNAALILKNIDKIENPIVIEWTPMITKPKNHSIKKRGYDVLNYCHQYKYTEDQLQKLKKIVNDGNKYVIKHVLNSPVFVPNENQNGIIMSITEISKKEIAEIENKKLSLYKRIKESREKDVSELINDCDYFGVEDV